MDTKVTVKLDESYMQYLQHIADDRADTKDVDRYKQYFHEDYKSERACDVLFILIDAAIEQGHIKTNQPSVVKRLWWNLEDLIPIENERSQKIVEKFKEFEQERVTEEELYAYAAKQPSVFKMLSEMLAQKGMEGITCETTRGYPPVIFFRDDKQIRNFSDEETETMLEVTGELIDLIAKQIEQKEKDQKAHEEYQRRAEEIVGGTNA